MKIQRIGKKMAREPNKNHGACKLRFPLKKHQMTNLDKIINDKPYIVTELIVIDSIGLSFFLKDASDEEPEILFQVIEN